MIKRAYYCKGIVIAHGRSEVELARNIKSNLHLPIEIYSNKNGANNIQIDGLLKILTNTVFNTKRALLRKYPTIEEDEEGNFRNFFIMPIMDLDDSKNIEQYKNKEMFKKLWLYDYIIPIWNEKNIDEVAYSLGIIDKIPNDKEKGTVYAKAFPVNRGNTDEEQVRNLMEKFKTSPKTNVEIFLEECLKNL